MKKHVALVAHDNLKKDLADWVAWNGEKLLEHHLVCTGTTGKMVAKTLLEQRTGAVPDSGPQMCRDLATDADYAISDSRNELPGGYFEMTLLKSGPLGGDQQLGSLIAEGRIDAVIFFWDPMQAQPHDVDVKALLRLATLYNVPTAVNRSSADFLISSPLFDSDDYRCEVHDYREYMERALVL